MVLPNDLVSQFVKATNDSKRIKEETTVFGTTVEYDGRIYVRLDGSELLTPVSTTAKTKPDERVTVLIKNHTATITGNVSSPAARTGDVSDLADEITNVEVLVAEKATIDELNVQKGRIDDLVVDNAVIKDMIIASGGEFGDLTADYAKINEKLTATEAEIDQLQADTADIGVLKSDVAKIDSLIFGVASGNTIQTTFANAVIAQLSDAQIKSAMIESISAGKIAAGDIVTNNVRVKSEDGKLLISDETIQISDNNRVRVQIGKDASNDYSINIWDTEGKLMFSRGGITDNAIKNAIIRDDMVSDTANISAHKLNIDSLFEEINGSSKTIKSTQIHLDDKNQTLDVAFKTLESDISDLDGTVTSQGTQISAIQGQISSKIWQQDINAATGQMNTQYSSLEQDIDSFKSTVSDTYATKTEFKNLEIGGRNLLTNSLLVQSSLKDGGEFVYSSTGKGVKTLSSSLSFEPGQYMCSLYMKRTEGMDVARIRLHKNGTTVAYYTPGTTSGKWARLRIPITVESAEDAYTLQLYNHNFGDEFDSLVNVKKLKIERGDKATDWTPAPEDVDTRIESAESSITQLSDKVAINITDISNLDKRASSVELTADGLTARLDNMRIGGRNLIVRSTETVGRYIGTDGSDVAAVACSLSEYIAIEPSTKYVFTKTTGVRDNYFRYAWYTEDKTYIGRAANANNEILWTSPSTAFYIRVSYPTECEVKFEKGSLATDWSPAPEDVNSDISDASKTATNYLNFSNTGLVVGNHTTSTLGKNVLIDSEAVKVRTGSTVNAVFGGDVIELAKDNESATISMLNGAFKIYYDADNSDGGFGVYGITSDGRERLAFQPVNENDNLTIGWGGYDSSENLTNIYGNRVNTFAKAGVSFSPGEGQFIECNGNVYLPNGRNIFASNKAGDKRSIAIWNASDQLLYGYGSYVNSEGTVYYDGNTVNIRSKKDVLINGRAYGKNQILWSGGRYMSADHTATLSAAVSAQPHGIVLVFSQYVDGAAANQSFCDYFIPKYAIANHSGKGHCIHMSTSSLSLYATKYLYISDTQITGHANNVAYGTSDCGIAYANSNFVLRYVIGV